MLRTRLRESMKWYSFLLPSILCLIVMTYIPTLTGLRYSFYDVSVMGFGETFVGIKNYTSLLKNKAFFRALKNTIILVLYGYSVIPLGMILASFINSLGRTRIQSVLRVGFFVPNVISSISVVLVFKYVLLKNGGLLNTFLSLFSTQAVEIGWLTDSNINKIGATIMSVWQGLGYAMLICLAGLQSIPGELYEAAEMDTANALQRWWHITVPNMVPILVFLLITNTISGFSRFSDLFVIGFNSASGGSRASLQTLLMYIYQYSFEMPQYGLSSAGAMILFVIVFSITMLNLRLTRVMDNH